MSTITSEQNELNKRPFSKWPIIAAVLLLLALVGGFFAARSYEAQKVEAGRESIAAENWGEAVAALDSAVSLQPAFLKQHTDEALAMRGFAHYQQGNDEAALADFGASMSINNRFFDLPAYRADILYRQGEYGEALGNANTALEHADVLPLYLQAQLHGQKALALMETGQETDADSEIEAAIALAEYLPDDMLSQLLTARALSAFADRDVEAGLADAAQVEALGFVEGALLVAKTAVLHQQSDYTAAIAASDSALATDQLTDEETVNLHLIRADIAYEQGDLDQAIAEADAAAATLDDLALPDALRAWQLYRQFAWADAVEMADAALELDGDSALAHRVRGAVAYWEGRYGDALTDLNRALELDPDDVEALALRASLYFSMSDEENGRFDAVRAVELAPQSPAALWAQAAVHLRDYETDEAYTLLTQTIALDDQRPELYDWRADTYLYTFQDDERAADLEAALALHPDFAPAIVSRLSMQLDMYDKGAYEETVQYLLDTYPDWDVTYRVASSYAVQMDDLELAMTYAEQAVALNPDRSKNYLTRGSAWLEMGEAENALVDFEHALEISPESDSVLTALSMYADDQEDYEASLSYLEEAFPSPYVQMRLANTYVMLGDLDTAWEMAHELLAVDPDYAEALMTRVFLWLDAGEMTEALNDLTVLINKHPDYAFAYRMRAGLRLDEGDLDAVRKDANRALELEPQMAAAHYLLGIAALMEEDLETAVSHIDEYVAAGDESVEKYGVQAELYLNQGFGEEGLAAIEAGLALGDDGVDNLLMLRALHYAFANDEENARVDVDTLLASSTDIDILVRAENIAAYLDTLDDLVNGRYRYEDANYTLTYSPDWDVEPFEQGMLNFALVQEGEQWGTIFLAGTMDGLTGYTTSTLAEVAGEGTAEMPGFQVLSFESASIAGESGLVLYYQLDTTDASGNPVTVLGRQYYLMSGETAVILSMEAAAEAHDQISPEWDAIVESFELLP